MVNHLNYLSIICSTSILILLMVNSIYTIKDFSSDSLGLHPVSNKLSFEDEYKLFEKELDEGIAKRGTKSRQKRYVFLNTESNVDVGFLIVVPVTVILPAMTNLFNNWRRKRSISEFYTNASMEGSPLKHIRSNKIASYFDLINIPELSCQLRAICEFSAEPSNFFPLSDLILSKINDPIAGEHFLETSHISSNASLSLFDLYSKAADEGATFGYEKCANSYTSGCKYSTDKLLNLPVMKFWKKIQSQLRLKLEDDS